MGRDSLFRYPHGRNGRRGALSNRAARSPDAATWCWLADEGSNSDPATEYSGGPRERQPLNAPTYYPGVADVGSGRPDSFCIPAKYAGGTDIFDVSDPLSFCVAGKALTGSDSTPLDISIESPTFVSGQFGHQNMRVIDMNPPLHTGKSGGTFRICDLPRGTWRIWMTQSPGINPPSWFGSATFSITDSDIRDLIVAPSVSTSLTGEVVFDDAHVEAQPDKAGLRRSGDMGLIVALQSLHAFQTLSLALRPWTRASLPGTFSLNGVFADDYTVSVSGLKGNTYVKDVTYGDRSVLNEPLHTESAMTGTSLRVTVGNDGGFIEVKPTGKDGNPLAGEWITVIPASATSEAAVAASHTSGQTDQSGEWKSGALAPGKYHVLATSDPLDMTPEALSAIMLERSRVDPVDVGANTTVTARVVAKDLE